MGNCESGAKPAKRERLTRWLAPLVLLLPGVVWFPVEAEAAANPSGPLRYVITAEKVGPSASAIKAAWELGNAST
jgi:hypothetical protein